MEKRKFKINILDFVIFIVILCSVAVLVFRDTVNEVFTKPETTVLEVTLFVDGEDNCALIRDSLENDAVFIVDVKTELQVNTSLEKFVVSPGSLTVPQRGELTVKISGYKRLGRFYTENGTRLIADSECAVIIGETNVACKLISVAIGG